MFKFFKEKLKKVVSKFSKKVEEEVEEKPPVPAKVEEVKPEVIPKPPKVKPEIPEVKEEVKPAEPEIIPKPAKVEEVIPEKLPEKVKEKPEEKRGFLRGVRERLVTKALPEQHFNTLFWELEMALLENNIAVSVIEKIKQDLKDSLVGKRVHRKKIKEIIEESLEQSLRQILAQEKINLINKIKAKKPYVICFFGNNGSGKTTTIAKLVYLLQEEHKLSCVLAASDTFRAASQEQLGIHAKNLGVKMIAHTYGADPAAVAFDAIEHAKSAKKDVVLIDTAGRSHSNINLMDELKKIVKVANPDLKIFVGDSLTGNDMVEQAEHYDEAIGIDAIILTKADVDEKGGAVISASYVTKKPIMFIGIGQEYKDLEEFNPERTLGKLL